jgi:hypothetical protein
VVRAFPSRTEDKTVEAVLACGSSGGSPVKRPPSLFHCAGNAQPSGLPTNSPTHTHRAGAVKSAKTAAAAHLQKGESQFCVGPSAVRASVHLSRPTCTAACKLPDTAYKKGLVKPSSTIVFGFRLQFHASPQLPSTQTCILREAEATLHSLSPTQARRHPVYKKSPVAA